MNSNNHTGFTLIEIAVSIGILALLAGLVLAAINPARQFAQARNAQRLSHVNQILSGIGLRIADNRGLFESGCAAGVIPVSEKIMSSAAGSYDIAPCLVPTYLPAFPFDLSAAGAHYSSVSDYLSGYAIQRDAASGRITVSAPNAELGETISATR